MDQTRGPLTLLAAFLAATTLTAGCASQQTTLPNAPTTQVQTSSVPSGPAPPPSPAGSAPDHGGRGSSAGQSQAPAAGLPAGWPPDLPIPAGTITGSTGSAGRWTVAILAAGSATQVRQSTMAFYSSVGFTPVTDSVLNKGNRQITLVVENRDHSATQTNLLIGVTTR